MRSLKAGAITAEYENGFLRRISHGETEVLRMVYFALRDENWNTFENHMQNEHVTEDGESFDVSYDCFNERSGVPLMEWRARLSGNRDGSIVFTLHGTAKQTFLKNRAGFCVLHPLSMAGEACRILHPDGNKTTGTFPEYVLPENPFQNIAGMEWQAAGAAFTLVFAGDVFETEDQRNWSDASYKTFCTPLNKPFPVQLNEGDYVFQQITFRPQEKLTPALGAKPFVSLRRTGLYSNIPSLGVAASTEGVSLTANAISTLRTLNLRHYRVDVRPSADTWVRDFSKDCEDAYALGLPLEVALHAGDDYEEQIESFLVLSLQNKVKFRKILLLQDNALVTSQQVIRLAARMKLALPGVLIGAGTDYNYNELNKNRFEAAGLDFISFGIAPQEHAVDDLTVLENAETHQHLVNSAKGVYGPAMPVHVSPVTLKKRFNPYATDPAARFLGENLKRDPRQKEDFAAIWTFASLCSLTRAGAAFVTYYQTVGPQGILSENGDPYPVYEVLRRFSPFQRMKAEIMDSSRPLMVQGVLLDGSILAVVNLTQGRQEVHVDSACLTLAPREMRFEKLNSAQ